MSTRRRLLFIAGCLVALLAVVYVARPAGHIPPYDADLNRLAETQLEGYCSGSVFWKTYGEGDGGAAAECREERAGMHEDVPNIPAVQRSFCRAVVAEGWDGTVPYCLEILQDSKLWPTYDGQLTQEWNRARKYPQPPIQVVGSEGEGSRTGGRENATTRNLPGGPTAPEDYGAEEEEEEEE
jgi:hypothetical protein